VTITIDAKAKRRFFIEEITNFYNEPPDIAFRDSRLRRVGRASGMSTILYLMGIVTQEENDFVYSLVTAVMGEKPLPDRPGTLIPEVT